eukprot:2703461-Amphidinium_carterae.1
MLENQIRNGEQYQAKSSAEAVLPGAAFSRRRSSSAAEPKLREKADSVWTSTALDSNEWIEAQMFFLVTTGC